MDTEIIRLLRERNEEGIALLQQEYGRMLHYLVFHILKSEEETEECLNDIWYRIWDKFSLFSTERGRLLPWVTAVARNTALNRLRRTGDFCETFEEYDLPTDSSEDEFFRKEQIARVCEAVKCLSHRERNLFLRKYYYMQTEKQIASELNLTVRAVEGRLYRLRKKLQKMAEVR